MKHERCFRAGVVVGAVLLASMAQAQQLETTPAWLEPETLYGQFGLASADGIDANGDGFDDVLVGGPFFYTPCCPSSNQQGVMLLYYGSALGFSSDYAWFEIGSDQGTTLGYRLANAGDVNGDGAEELLFSSGSGFGNGTHAIHLRLGSPDGPAGAWNYDTLLQFGALGPGVDGDADVNGDGYDDIVAGFPRINGNNGKLLVFYGSPTGPGVAPDWEVDGTAGQRLGLDVAFAGDVDGDGYDDLLVCDRTAGGDRVLLYGGSSVGLGSAPSWSFDVPDANCEYNHAVDGVGDLDGDGFDDFAIGESRHNHTGGVGAVRIFLGAASGPSAQPAATLFGDEEFGFSVSALGDVNADGHADLAVGAPGSGSERGPGRAFVFYGSHTGVFPEPMWTSADLTDSMDLGSSVARADVDGDGLPELLVGDPNAVGFNFGRVALFANNATLVSGPAASIDASGSSSLLVARRPDGALGLVWGPTCEAPSEDYVVYEGVLRDFASHVPISPCGTAGATSWTVPTSSGSRYYLIVPCSLDSEGSYGLDGDGFERAPSSVACFPQAATSCN